jgi:hypothetical protein
MKKVLLTVITASIFMSCQKEDDLSDPVKNALISLQGKYLVCDSVKTTTNGLTTTQVLGKGKGWDRTFGLYGNLEIYSSPVLYKNYQYQSPDKIYYSNTNAPSQMDQYFTIQSITNTKLILIETEQGTGKVFREYFTAQ